MSVADIEASGFWKSMWLRLTGNAPVVAQFAKDTPGRVPAPPMLEAPVRKPAAAMPIAIPPVRPAISFAAASIAAPANPARFMLAARLASTHSLNTPKHRDGKAPVSPRDVKPVAAGIKAKPKTTEAVVKTSVPQRHVWLSARPPVKTAEIVRFQPKSSRQAGKRAA